jgi:hypothetical protein
LEVPGFVRHAGEYLSTDYWTHAWVRASAGTPGATTGIRTVAPLATGADPWLEFFVRLAAAASGAVALAWVVWGVFCLAVGPRARKGVLRFAGAAIAVAIIVAGLKIYAVESAADRVFGTTGLTRARFNSMQYWSRAGPIITGRPDEEWANYARMEAFRQGGTDLALPVLLILLLTREPVKALFVRPPRKTT